MALQLDFGFAPRPKLRISEVQKLLGKHRILGNDAPCRETIINWCEDGTLEAVYSPVGYLVYEDSFVDFVRRLDAGDRTVFASMRAEFVAA